MKLRIKNYVFLAFVMIPLIGCGVVSNQYTEGNYVSRSSISLKPSYRDSTESAIYIGGAIHGTNGKSGFNPGESSTFGLINIHKAITKEHMNFSYGGYLHGGNYKANNQIDLQGGNNLSGGNKSFVGGGVSSEINYTLPSKHVDWRVIGAKLSYQYEGGEFATFRESAYELRHIGNERRKLGSLRLNVTSELIFKLQNADFGYGISVSSGEYIYVGSKLFFTASKITLSLERSQSIPDDGGKVASLIGFGLAYRLK